MRNTGARADELYTTHVGPSWPRECVIYTWVFGTHVKHVRSGNRGARIGLEGHSQQQDTEQALVT